MSAELLDQALALAGRGFHVVGIRQAARGKLPLGEWREFVERAPSPADLYAWAEDRRLDGWALLCGTPARLVCLDVEAAGVADPRLRALLDRLPASCRVPSPGGGEHAWLTVTDADAPGGRKLAHRVDGLDDKGKPRTVLLVETRGHGQYAVILGPGRVVPADFAPHPVTLAQLDELLAEAAACSDLKPRPPRRQRRTEPGQPSGSRTADVLRDLLLDGLLGWQHVLEPGWTRLGYDRDGRSLWLRPPYGDPPTSATSANGAERMAEPAPTLVVWSSAVPWADEGEAHTPTDVLAACWFDGDLGAALRAVDELAGGVVVEPFDRWPAEAVEVVVDRLGWFQPGEPIQLSNVAKLQNGPDDEQPDDEQPDDEQPGDEQPERPRVVTGGRFVLDAPAGVPAVWGDGDDVLWARGESLLVSGPEGVGKSFLAGQLVRARLGLRAELLGLPVAPGRRVLYVAADRPAQAARLFRSLYAEADREVLDERLLVWRGPLPRDLGAHPSTLLALAEAHDVDTLVLDSLKDVALGLVDDTVGATYNRARQLVLEAGVELLELHHQTKRGGGGVGKPTTLADVYGSRWLTAGAGSVLLLWGAAGDPVVALDQLKQPAEQVGPLRLLHDHHAGASTVFHAVDVLAVLTARRDGLTARGLARLIEEKDTPSEAAVEKARRRLDRLVRAGLAERLHTAAEGGAGGGGRGDTYRAASAPRTPHAASDEPAPHARPTDSRDERETRPTKRPTRPTQQSAPRAASPLGDDAARPPVEDPPPEPAQDTLDLDPDDLDDDQLAAAVRLTADQLGATL